MAAVKKAGYTPEQLGNADKLARFLKNESEETQSIIVAMGNAFVSGLEIGMRFPVKQTAR